jgi:hypothetical protein
MYEENKEETVVSLNDKIKSKINGYFNQIIEIEGRIKQDILLVLEAKGYDTDKIEAVLNNNGDIIVTNKQ